MNNRYRIEKSKEISADQFFQNILSYCFPIHGVEIRRDSLSPIYDDFDQALLENERFMYDVKAQDYYGSLSTMRPSMIYFEMLGEDLENDLLPMYEEQINEEVSVFYDNFKCQAEDIEGYLQSNDNIIILEDNREGDEFDASYIVEFDDEILPDVEKFLEDTNNITANKNSEIIECDFYEDEYDTLVFESEFSDLGSLDVVAIKIDD